MITPPPLSSLVLFLLSLIYFLFSTSSTFSWGLVCWYMDTSLVTKLLKISLPPHHSLNAYKFLGMHEAPWSPDRSITECFLVQSCTSNHSCCEFRDTIATSCPKVSVPFHTLTLALKFFCPFFYAVPEPWMDDTVVAFMAGHSKVIYSQYFEHLMRL